VLLRAAWRYYWASPTAPLRKEPILNLCESYRCGTFLVIVRHMVNPSAHGIAPHQPSIAGLQQFGRCSYIRHSRIKPSVVAVWIEDDGHAVVDG
jgi:hypothetical protein